MNEFLQLWDGVMSEAEDRLNQISDEDLVRIATPEETITCLLDGNRGIYIPQAFVERFGLERWGVYDEEDERILLEGPDAEHYDDVWCRVLDDASYTDFAGHKWTLYQRDGDVFAVRDDHNWEE